MKITIGYGTAIVTAIAVNNWVPGIKGLIPMPSVVDTMMMQGGIGLLLTTLLITIPPAVSQFVGGTLGAGVSGFGPWSGGNPGKGQDTKTEPNNNNNDGGAADGSISTTQNNRITPSGGAVANGLVDQIPANAQESQQSPQVQLANIDTQLVNRGVGVTPAGNIYQLGGNESANMALADAGKGPIVSADIKALAAQREALAQQVKANA